MRLEVNYRRAGVQEQLSRCVKAHQRGIPKVRIKGMVSQQERQDDLLSLSINPPFQKNNA